MEIASGLHFRSKNTLREPACHLRKFDLSQQERIGINNDTSNHVIDHTTIWPTISCQGLLGMLRQSCNFAHHCLCFKYWEPLKLRFKRGLLSLNQLLLPPSHLSDS